MIFLVIDNLPGVDGPFHWSPCCTSYLHQRRIGHIVAGNRFRELHVVRLIGIEHMQLAVVDEEFAVVDEDGTLRIKYFWCIIEHRLPCVHRLQSRRAQTVEVLVCSYEVCIFAGLSCMRTANKAGLTLQILAIRRAIHIIVASRRIVNQHQRIAEHLDIGLSLTLSQQIETAHIARLCNNRIWSILVIGNHAVHCIPCLTIHIVLTGIQVAGPLQVFLLTDSLLRRPHHLVANLLLLIGIVSQFQVEPAILQLLRISIIDFHVILYIRSRGNAIEHKFVGSAHGINIQLDLAHLLIGQIVVVAIVFCTTGKEASGKEQEATGYSRYFVVYSCHHDFWF